MAVIIMLHQDVQSSVTPLVRPAVTQLVREMVVIEEDTIGETVVIFEKLFSVHEYFHRLSPMDQLDNDCDEANGTEHHEKYNTRTPERVGKTFQPILPRHCIKSVLCVEMLERVHRRIVNAADDPRRTVERPTNRVRQAPEGVRCLTKSVWTHNFFAC
eukprot:CAMPEP_0194485284 /NCGR_PEP_ID=MMETSP0253-20130528/6339_1 /TAXON_ID=2966 /ORGANISM="Noctiluca scintillans" /LENGTH=157 /DNA_ID=CAMNT_0039325245 /DNA_START=10 /DNA_END=483 /DNA_ORIENTATION=+